MRAEGKIDLDKGTYKNLIVSKPDQLCSLHHTDTWLQASVQTAVRASDMDIDLPLRDQAQEVVVLVIASVCRALSHPHIPSPFADLLTRSSKSTLSSRSIAVLGR